jgi:hypothetical protein
MAEHAGAQGSAEEERRLSRLNDPDVRRRIREIQQEIERGETADTGVGVEELPEFLRERGG